MRALLEYDFCNIEVYDDYVLAIMFEGITVAPNYNDVLLSVSENYFKNKLFGYITHRIHSYSVDPRIYFETSKIKNLVAFAVVSSKQIDISNTELEKIFLKKPFKHFIELENAINWVKEKCVKHQNI